MLRFKGARRFLEKTRSSDHNFVGKSVGALSARVAKITEEVLQLSLRLEF
jgi:hypothetical protein